LEKRFESVLKKTSQPCRNKDTFHNTSNKLNTLGALIFANFREINTHNKPFEKSFVKR